MLTIGQIIFRLLLSVVLSGVIGLEREMKHRPAGLRTNILVGLGSTLMMLTSMYVGGVDNVDSTRLASGVIAGIGFLGAGVIMRGKGDKDDEMVHGITTAATIWVIAAIGLAVGLGFYLAAIFTAVLTLIVLLFFSNDRLRDKLEKL